MKAGMDREWRMPILFLFLALVALMFGGAQSVIAASFSCDEASTRVERLICKDKDLSYLDGRLGEIYGVLRKNLSTNDRAELKRSQRNWLTDIREKRCVDKFECLLVYTERLNDLKLMEMKFQVRSWLKKLRGESTNRLVWKDSFKDFIRHFSNNEKLRLLGNDWLLQSDLISVLGGPPNDVGYYDGYYIGSACRAHSCPEKGIFAIRESDLAAIFGVTSGKNLTLIYRDESFFKEVRGSLVQRAIEEAQTGTLEISPVKLD